MIVSTTERMIHDTIKTFYCFSTVKRTTLLKMVVYISLKNIETGLESAG